MDLMLLARGKLRDIFALSQSDETRLTVNYRHQESDEDAAPHMEGQGVLMLALRIAIAWTAVSFLCIALWLVFLETGRFFGSAKARKFHRKTPAGFGATHAPGSHPF
jgi:hypothetical protein